MHNYTSDSPLLQRKNISIDVALIFQWALIQQFPKLKKKLILKGDNLAVTKLQLICDIFSGNLQTYLKHLVIFLKNLVKINKY